ncbi:MAG: carbohydrate porin [Candidatus Omnitrophota bacterium]
MPRDKVLLTVTALVTAIGVFLCAAASADTGSSNEDMLREIRELKKIVEFQQKKIEDLEQRVIKTESSARAVGEPVSATEIDKRIDERLKQRAPAYQLMEGLSLGVQATTIVQGARDANGDTLLSQGEDETDANMTVNVDFNKKFGEYGEGYVQFKSAPGAGLDRSLKLYGNVNNNACDDSSVYMPEAWYEHYFQNLSAALTFGKLDMTNYIDTNEYANMDTTQFISGIFGNSPVIEFPASNGAGVHFGMAPYDFFDVNFVAADSKSQWDNVFDAMFLAGEINFKPRFLSRPGNYRFTAWRNGNNHTKWRDSSKEKENGYGYGVSFDQEVTDIAGVFVRYGWQDPDVYLSGNTVSLERSWSIGPQFKGAPWGRPDDVTGVGFGRIVPSGKYKSVNNLQAKTESHLEWYYNYKVNEHLSLSPDLQIIWRPYGKDAANGDGTIVVGGLRGQMAF